MASEEKKPKEDVKIIADIYDFLRWLYTATSAWRIDSPNRAVRISYNLYKAINYTAYVYHTTTLYLGVVDLIDNLPMLSFGISYLLICVFGVTKIFITDFNVDKLKKLDVRLKNNFYLPWLGKHEWENDVKRKTAHYLTMIAKVLLLATSFGILATIFLPVFPESKLIFVIPSPFDHLSRTSFFLPIFFSQVFSLINFIFSFVVHDLMLVGTIMRLCDHLEIIETNLKQIEIVHDYGLMGRESGLDSAAYLRVRAAPCCYTPCDMEQPQQEWLMREKRMKTIKNCIAHYQAVYSEVKLVGKIFSYSVSIYVFCAPVLIGLLAYVILSDTGSGVILMQQASYGIPAILFLFLVCYFGTQLAIHCENVRFALYDCPWYEMDVRTRKLIITALTTMEKTGRLRAGKLVDISLRIFLSTLKVSYNIVAFLKNTK